MDLKAMSLEQLGESVLCERLSFHSNPAHEQIQPILAELRRRDEAVKRLVEAARDMAIALSSDCHDEKCSLINALAAFDGEPYAPPLKLSAFQRPVTR